MRPLKRRHHMQDKILFGLLLRDRQPLAGDIEHARKKCEGNEPRMTGVDLRNQLDVLTSPVLNHEPRFAVVIDVQTEGAPQRRVETTVRPLVDDPLEIEHEYVARFGKIAGRQRGSLCPRELVHREQGAHVA